MKSFKWPKHSILAIAIFATWLKTVIVYHTSFELDIENAMQELILIINPLSFILFAYGISLFFKTEKLRNRYLITVSAFLAIVLFANVGFYRFYNDFITFAVLFQTSNFGDLGNSVADIISFTDILYFADLIVLLIAIKFIPKSEGITPVRIEMRRAYFVLSMAIVFLNLGLSETERPQLLTRAFDRELLVKTSVRITIIYMTSMYSQSQVHSEHWLMVVSWLK